MFSDPNAHVWTTLANKDLELTKPGRLEVRSLTPVLDGPSGERSNTGPKCALPADATVSADVAVPSRT